LKTHGLSADDRIKSKKDFEIIYSKGKYVFSQCNRFNALYYIEKNSEYPGVKIAPVVHKKAGPAPWRNRIKRLIKEVYRLNKYLLLDLAMESSTSIKIVFACNLLNVKNSRKISYNVIYPDIYELIVKISKDL